MADNLTVLRSIAKKIETMPERELLYLLDVLRERIDVLRLERDEQRGEPLDA